MSLSFVFLIIQYKGILEVTDNAQCVGIIRKVADYTTFSASGLLNNTAPDDGEPGINSIKTSLIKTNIKNQY
ncbi:hypothetical protein [Necropsobacter massiliensis]|uniref:hypothetical protein n=1 Tax=Necropsobacter massiliensis TaxID=1400001 RepID=UPI001C5964A2|nr:hypothetical protein [Necropsobacter massiliensis]